METITVNITSEKGCQNLAERLLAKLKGTKGVTVIIGSDSRPVTERIKTLADALAATGKTMPDFSALPEEMQGKYRALFAIEVITAALNEGWQPDWNNTAEYKYYPYFKVSSGFVFDYADCLYSYAGGGNGARLCFKTAALAEYAGRQFTELYKEFMM